MHFSLGSIVILTCAMSVNRINMFQRQSRSRAASKSSGTDKSADKTEEIPSTGRNVVSADSAQT